MNAFDPSDPRLTAYALGELDAAEAKTFEAQLASDLAMRAAVGEIRETAAMLTAGFAAETGPGLTDAQRLAVEQPAPIGRGGSWIFRSQSLWAGAGLAAAACVTVAVFISQNAAQRDSTNDVAILNRTVPAIEQGILDARESNAQIGDAVRDKDTVVDLHYRLGTKVEALQHSKAADQQPLGGAGFAGGEGGVRHQMAQSEAVEVTPSAESKSRSDSPPAAGRPARAPGSASSSDRAAPPPPPSQVRREYSPATALSDPDPRIVAEKSAVAQERLRKELQYGAPEDIDSDQRKSDRDAGLNRDEFKLIVDNAFLAAAENPLSTFSVDVDTASYSIIKRYVRDGQLPPRDAVRIEEMINSFAYHYEPASGDVPFSANVEVNAAPWNPEHRLLRIGLRGREVTVETRPATSLVFLIDVSGSMNQPDKLPLVKQSLKQLIGQLHGDDRLAIVTYAGSAGLALDSTWCSDDNKANILSVIDGLAAGGSTNGAGGIHVAYATAEQHFIKGGVNRVILCTDGDFNVGVSSEADLVRLIQDKRSTGVYLSVLGFGSGNLQDGKMKQLSVHGNGNYAYVGNEEDGKKALVDQMTGTLVTIAKDVKVQIDFNPGKVGAYRLIGYENRVMAAQDFRDDLKDAGEIGAGHTVTALYEIVPAGSDATVPETPKTEFIEAGKLVPSDLLARLKLRYKEPDGTTAKEIAFPVKDDAATLEKASDDFRFAAAVAGFGMLLRDSPHKGTADIPAIKELAQGGLGEIPPQERLEFLDLLDQAAVLLKSRTQP